MVFRSLLLTMTVVGVARAQNVAQAPRANRQAQMEQLARVVQRRLNLNPDQVARLRETTDRYAQRRQQVVASEREARRSLRAALASSDSTNDAVVGRHLDDVVRFQQQRTELLADEQRDLAKFLSPRQRAGFLALQERAARAAQQLRQRRNAKPEP